MEGDSRKLSSRPVCGRIGSLDEVAGHLGTGNAAVDPPQSFSLRLRLLTIVRWQVRPTIYKPNVSFPWLPVAIFHPLEAPRVYRLGRPPRFRRRHFPLRFNNSAPTPYRTD